MRYVIIGAGAIGGTIGAMLAQSGHSVVLVARGPHLHILQRKGLTFSRPSGRVTLQLPAVAASDEIDLASEDVLVLCVKSQDTEAALEAWAGRPVAGGGLAADVLPLVCAQNGVQNERTALRWFANVYGMSTMVPATHLTPGDVSNYSDPVPGVLVIGRYPAGTDDLAERIAADLSEARFIAPVVPDIQRWKYAKLAHNTSNAIEALSGQSGADPDAERLAQMAIAEAWEVLAGAGIDSAVTEQAAYLEQVSFDEIPGSTTRFRTSTWQSLDQATGRIETAYLNGEIVLLGRLHGIPAPVNTLLHQLAERAVKLGLRPGFVTCVEILAALDSNASIPSPGTGLG
jgi:2-dehydropantoate 2-reductase